MYKCASPPTSSNFKKGFGSQKKEEEEKEEIKTQKHPFFEDLYIYIF